MTSPSPESMKDAKKIISDWVLGKIPAYEDKIKQIALALDRAKEQQREADARIAESVKGEDVYHDAGEVIAREIRNPGKESSK
jgi:hypothetical protein